MKGRDIKLDSWLVSRHTGWTYVVSDSRYKDGRLGDQIGLWIGLLDTGWMDGLMLL